MLIVQYKQGSDLKKSFKKVLTFSCLGCIIVTYSDEQPQNELRTECKNKKQKQTKKQKEN